MKLSIADRLALIYTSAGSIRKTAALAGLTHQQVSRILHNAASGRSNQYYEARDDIAESVQVAFDIHKDVARGVAKRHGLPFDGNVPIYAERLPLAHKGVFVGGELVFKGSPEYCRDFIEENELQGQARIRTLLGERVGALHTHWLDDRLRNAWIKTSQKSGAYYSASVGSIVNLQLYNKQANERDKERVKTGLPRTRQRITAREQIKAELRAGVERQRVFTPYTSMARDAHPDIVLQSINEKLETRHAPATGESGTKYADQILLQLDTRKDKNANKGKARGNKRRNR